MEKRVTKFEPKQDVEELVTFIFDQFYVRGRNGDIWTTDKDGYAYDGWWLVPWIGY